MGRPKRSSDQEVADLTNWFMQHNRWYTLEQANALAYTYLDYRDRHRDEGL